MCLTNSSTTMNNSSSLNNKNDDILHIIYDYTSKGDDELTLKRGSKVEVLSKDEKISGSEGWWTGRLVDSESVGVFPANFVATSQPNLRIIDFKDLQIGDLIGVGGFGHVHYGKFGDVDVAIKSAKSLTSFCSIQTSTLNKNIDDDKTDAVQKSLIEGLLHEARLFSNLKHRNIIQLFGVCPSISTRNLYLVMEYAHGGALSQLLQIRKSGLYPNVFIQYAKQIVDGMRYLHDEACEHIIHRDLKCSNILILELINDAHNDNELLQKTLKITDFGLARKQLQSSSMSTAGTFAWMSPECIRNSEFSTKSDVWSFGVLLWECLTGEIPYKGFDQMQVAFGIATSKYSLPIPSTCPEEFSQLMKNCWQNLTKDRPTFSQLFEQIDTIIETSYVNNESNNMEPNEESYQSLQQDWREEIQDMFEELKTKEQQIRDRELAMIQQSVEQNHRRMLLQKKEEELHEREMLLIEGELKLLMAANNQERLHQQTPKIQKRSGRFMRSLLHSTLNGNASLSSTTATNLISSPTNFRHIMSISRDQNFHSHHSALDHGSSATLPASSASSTSPISSSSTNTPSSHSSNSHITPNGSCTSNSTPATPNLSRLRTLTSSGDLLNKIDVDEFVAINNVHFPLVSEGSSITTAGTPPNKPPRSSSTSQAKATSGTIQRLRWRKSKPWSSSSSSTSLKRKHGKTNVRLGEAKWYLETISPKSTINNNDNASVSSTISTPTIDRPTRKLEISDEISSSSSSSCSTPNDRSLSRAIFDINSMLTTIGLGRRVPAQLNSSELSPSPKATSKTLHHQTVLRSTSETTNKIKSSSSSSSTTTTPSPSTRKQHKRTCSSPVTNMLATTSGSPKATSRARPAYSPVRPTSLVISSIPPPLPSSSRSTNISQSDSHLDDKHSSHRNRAMNITSTPEEDEQTDRFYSAQSSKISTPMAQSMSSSSNKSNSQPQLNLSSILDIDTEEQRKHKTSVLSPDIDKNKCHVSHQSLERDFLH